MTSGTAKVTVVVLMNAYEPGSQGTVWIVPGDYQPERDDEELPDELDRAIRIVGPIELDACPAVVKGLRKAFESVGIEVEEQVYCND